MCSTYNDHQHNICTPPLVPLVSVVAIRVRKTRGEYHHKKLRGVTAKSSFYPAHLPFTVAGWPGVCVGRHTCALPPAIVVRSRVVISWHGGKNRAGRLMCFTRLVVNFVRVCVCVLELQRILAYFFF